MPTPAPPLAPWQQAGALDRLQFLEKDLFEVDFSRTDFVVANNFGFGDEMNDRLLNKLHQELRVGAVVVALRELLPAWAYDQRRRTHRLQRDGLVSEREEGVCAREK